MNNRTPSSPPGKLITGNLSDFARDPLGFLESCSRDYGDFVPLRFFHRRVILINDPMEIEQVLATQSKNFRKTIGYRSPIMRRLFGQGLLTSEGTYWMKQRRLAQPAFHKERISFYSKHIISYTDEMLADWKDGQTKNVHEEILKLTTRVVTKSLFGVEAAEEVSAVGESSKIVMEHFNTQFSIWRLLLGIFPSRQKREFEGVMKRLDRFVYGVISERRNQESVDLVSMLLNARDENGCGMTDQQLRDELVTLMVAGLDTTALALSWGLYLLAGNPGAQQKLQSELDENLKGKPGLENLPHLLLAEAVIKESMRLYPPAWIVGREALQDCVVGGKNIAKGDSIIMSQWLKHRDARYFENPESFQPERWLKNEEMPRFAYFPFGGGPRICIGSSFAMVEAILVLSSIMQEFSVKRASEAEVAPWPAITLQPRGPINLLIQKRR